MLGFPVSVGDDHNIEASDTADTKRFMVVVVGVRSPVPACPVVCSTNLISPVIKLVRQKDVIAIAGGEVRKLV
ncbi:MAG: hypothetical protein NZL92_09050 [Gloeomargarita sp. SKYG116]|nr:hypothetical protein [Gloeomargarita sp. SKYG116]MDW8401828.1 hypothetical protein [Gloeomargarita sp. SKYGB_i_bin116]